MKRIAGLSALTLIMSTISGCGWIWGDHGYFRDRGSDYLQATQAPPMKLPEDIASSKRLNPLLPIPQNIPDSTAKGDYLVPRPQPLAASNDVSDYRLQKNPTTTWILAQHPPAQVWPVVHQFFLDNGFHIDEERPQTGEFTTTWQRYDELAGSMSQRLQAASGAATADKTQTRVRVRIEPSLQRDTSDIYIVSVQRPVGSTADVPWPDKSASIAVDSALNDEMLASMSRSADKTSSVSLLAAHNYDVPNRVTLTDDGAGNPVLHIGDDLDRAWASVGRALNRGDWRVEDINRSLGVYYINLSEAPQTAESKPGFFSRLFGTQPSKAEVEARAQRYQVRLSTVGDNVQVTVEKDINTLAPSDVSRRVLGVIQDNMG